MGVGYVALLKLCLFSETYRLLRYEAVDWCIDILLKFINKISLIWNIIITYFAYNKYCQQRDDKIEKLSVKDRHDLQQVVRPTHPHQLSYS